MSAVVIALDQPRASALAEELADLGVTVIDVLPVGAVPGAAFGEIDALIMPATRNALSAEVVAACDRAGIRIIALGDGDSRLLSRFGITGALPADAAATVIASALADDAPPAPMPARTGRTRVVAVWGPHGAPGRSTVAIQLAVELARAGHRTALLDADTVAPSLALLLGLSDEAPGLAAACRRAELGGLDQAELSRLAASVETSGGSVEVLGGLNRPSRWPELSADRLRGTLAACRDWVDRCVVDTSAAFEADDEVTWDLEGPRRHAATAAVLADADEIVAVASADPLGVARFLRDHAELRGIVGDTPVRVVVNRVRPGPLGIDARGQVRRTLERFAGITDVGFLPYDQRATDAALLHARPVADVSPRSPLVAGIRRLAHAGGETTDAAVTAGSRRGSSPGVRSRRRARAVPAGSRRGSDPGWAS
ncbi:P-loop NTPase [Microbacterium sp. M28]|uniref:AAA family ATPase n=1 Tax=Microbacterium sp. M28 TaxID=2962064 RepID=UPI0021F3F2A0|nr:P-loop NTPase [Microbacterium sp. M28]UYO98210.1 P-loop NTPase [Microbacterium sp. M28]